MYRDAPGDHITPERALAQAVALDPKLDTLVSVHAIDAVQAILDVELSDGLSSGFHTTQAVGNLPGFVGDLLWRGDGPTERVDASSLPEYIAVALARVTKRYAKSGTVLVCHGGRVRRERVFEALVRRGLKRQLVWVGTSPVRLLAAERQLRIPRRTRTRLTRVAAAVLTVAPVVALTVVAPVALALLPSAGGIVVMLFTDAARFDDELPIGPAWKLAAPRVEPSARSVV